MRRYLGLVVALVLVAGLALFAVNEVNRDKAEGKKAALEPVFPYGGAQITEVALRNTDGEATFRRGAGGWEKVAGPDAADTGSVADMIGAWSRVRILEVILDAPGAEDLGRFGLDKPTIVVKAKLADPAAATTPGHEPALEVGKPAPLQPAFYARVDGFPRVVLVSADVLDLEKGIGRRVLGLEPIVPDAEHPGEANVGARPVPQR